MPRALIDPRRYADNDPTISSLSLDYLLTISWHSSDTPPDICRTLPLTLVWQFSDTPLTLSWQSCDTRNTIFWNLQWTIFWLSLDTLLTLTILFWQFPDIPLTILWHLLTLLWQCSWQIPDKFLTWLKEAPCNSFRILTLESWLTSHYLMTVFWHSSDRILTGLMEDSRNSLRSRFFALLRIDAITNCDVTFWADLPADIAM
jgi:hypothetical protein